MQLATVGAYILQVLPDKKYPAIQTEQVDPDVVHSAQGDVHAVHEVAVATQNPALHFVQVMVVAYAV